MAISQGLIYIYLGLSKVAIIEEYTLMHVRGGPYD